MKEYWEILTNIVSDPEFVAAYGNANPVFTPEFVQEIKQEERMPQEVQPPENSSQPILNNFQPIVLRYFGGGQKFIEFSPGHFKVHKQLGSRRVSDIVFKPPCIAVITMQKDSYGTYRGMGWQHICNAISDDYTLSLYTEDEVMHMIYADIKANRLAVSVKKALLTEGEQN
jgi:hypothetical protein